MKKWVNDNIIVNRTKIATAMIMFLIVSVVYVYAQQTYGNYILGLLIGPQISIAFILSFTLSFEVIIPEIWKKIYGIILLLVSPAVAFWGMEYVVQNIISDMMFDVIIFNYGFYLVIYLLLYIISNRIWMAVSIGNVICFIYIVINYFVMEYKGNPIRAYDVLAIRTALGVAEQYEYKLTIRMLTVMVWFLILMILSMKVRWKEKNIKKRLVIDLVLLSTIWGMVVVCLNKEFIEKNDMKPIAWEVQDSIKKHGVLGDFVAGIPYIKIEKPEGYSVNLAKKIQMEGAVETTDLTTDEDTVKPDVIAIMNESFSDLRVLGDIQVSQEYLEYFYSLNENVIRGQLYVPVRGGTTCNTEFEFITGYSCAFLAEGTTAYQTVIKNGTSNLGKEFKEEGYYSFFMHPYYAKGWSRNNVYKNFGFDSDIYIEDLNVVEEDVIKMYMTDEADYRNLISYYEEGKAEGNNMFMFNVTMQNHGGYGWGMSDVEVFSPVDETKEANEYLSLVKKSDEAFKKLIEYYSEIDTPTIILMFGDHQPTLQNFTELLNGDADSNSIAEKMKEYCVPFIIWANYDIDEKVYDGISANYLSIVLKEVANQPLTEYQKFLKSVMQMYPVITNRAVKDSDDNWYTIEEAREFEVINNYNIVQYWNLIDDAK